MIDVRSPIIHAILAFQAICFKLMKLIKNFWQYNNARLPYFLQ